MQKFHIHAFMNNVPVVISASDVSVEADETLRTVNVILTLPDGRVFRPHGATLDCGDGRIAWDGCDFDNCDSDTWRCAVASWLSQGRGTECRIIARNPATLS